MLLQKMNSELLPGLPLSLVERERGRGRAVGCCISIELQSRLCVTSPAQSRHTFIPLIAGNLHRAFHFNPAAFEPLHLEMDAIKIIFKEFQNE
jgi:hypothetical protein